MTALWRHAVPAVTLVLLAGCAAAPDPGTSADAGLSASRGDRVTVLAPPELGDQPRSAWLTRLEWAAETLAGTGFGTLDDTWDGQLVVELPGTAGQYQELAGAGMDDAAAVTRCPPGGARITVNPVVGANEPWYLDSLVLHEAVHVATGSSCGGEAPQWVEEGLAEWVACEHSSESLAANQAWVMEYLERHGVPEALPDDPDFTADPDSVSAAYALARQAVAVAIDQLGEAGAMDYFAGAYDGRQTGDATTAEITSRYLAELAALSGSGQR
jgi:hypothetical protein